MFLQLSCNHGWIPKGAVNVGPLIEQSSDSVDRYSSLIVLCRYMLVEEIAPFRVFVLPVLHADEPMITHISVHTQNVTLIK